MLPPGPWAAFLPRPPGRPLARTLHLPPFPSSPQGDRKGQVSKRSSPQHWGLCRVAAWSRPRHQKVNAGHHWGVTCTPALPEGEETPGEVALITSSASQHLGFPGGTSAREPACQRRRRRRHRFSPGAGRSPGAGNGTHSSILACAWKIPRTEEPGGLQSMGVTKIQT